MTQSYPKPPQEILVCVEENAGEGGKAYFQILSTFMEKLKFEEDVTRDIILQLMTLGKLRIEVDESCNRYELVRKEDLLNERQAKALYDDYINTKNKFGKSKTMSISIQRPRH